LLSVPLYVSWISMPTNTLLTHCRRDGSTGDVIRNAEDLQSAWLQGTQHGDALVLSSASGVVRSLGKRTQGCGCCVVPESRWPKWSCRSRRLQLHAGSDWRQIAEYIAPIQHLSIYHNIFSRRRHAKGRLRHLFRPTAALRCCGRHAPAQGQVRASGAGSNGRALSTGASLQQQERWSHCTEHDEGPSI
jgi:hypothetical protein